MSDKRSLSTSRVQKFRSKLKEDPIKLLAARESDKKRKQLSRKREKEMISKNKSLMEKSRQYERERKRRQRQRRKAECDDNPYKSMQASKAIYRVKKSLPSSPKQVFMFSIDLYLYIYMISLIA